jgi:hypothetical protein
MEFIFKHIDPLAVLVFIFCTLAVTEGLKFALSKHVRLCAILDVGFYKICLSWAVGAVMFFALHFTLHKFPVTEASILQFAIWVLLLNGGYKVIASLLDYIKELKAKI